MQPVGPSSDLSTCPSCGAAAPLEAAYCGHCGKPLQLTTALHAAAPGKWYHNIWLVLFMLFFVLGPFGLPLVWKNPRFSQTVKIILTVAMALYTLALVQTVMVAAKIVTEQITQFQSAIGF